MKKKKILLNDLRLCYFRRILPIAIIIFFTFNMLTYWYLENITDKIIKEISDKQLQNALLNFKLIQTIQFGLWFLGIISLLLISILAVRIAQRDSFLSGFKNGRDGKKKS